MRRSAAIVVAAATLVLAAPARAQSTITMSGSPVARALVADLAYFYRHDVPDPPAFSLTGGANATGIADAERGIVDAGLVTRDLLPGDPPDLVFTRLAGSALCLVTNRANPVPGITRAQVQDIVAGRVTSWSQVAGSSRSDAIVPVALAPTTGSGQLFLTDFVDVATPVSYRPVTFVADAQVRDFVAQTPAAFGYVDLALTEPLHAAPFEGVGCTRATVRAGTYPARRSLGVVTKGRPRGSLGRFLRWARTSPRARRAIAARYVP